MATQLSIINLAFSHLTEPTVLTLDGDPRAPNVVKALAQWDQALDVALSRAPWLCALERRSIDPDLAPTQGWGDWKYPARYTLPTGTLKVWSVGLCEGGAWERGTAVDANGAAISVIRAGAVATLPVELCVRRKAEVLTPLLADALAWELAARLAGPIQSSEEKGRWAEGRAETAYALAASAEASEIGGQDPLIAMGGMQAARRWAG